MHYSSDPPAMTIGLHDHSGLQDAAVSVADMAGDSHQDAVTRPTMTWLSCADMTGVGRPDAARGGPCGAAALGVAGPYRRPVCGRAWAQQYSSP